MDDGNSLRGSLLELQAQAARFERNVVKVQEYQASLLRVCEVWVSRLPALSCRTFYRLTGHNTPTDAVARARCSLARRGGASA
jgi:hypothetical protein